MYLESFPLKLKKIRLENNLTQEEMSKILETSKQAISAYESGKVSPSLNSLIKLTSYFGISFDSLIYDKVDTDLLNSDISILKLELVSIRDKVDSLINFIDVNAPTCAPSDLNNYISSTLENPNSENKSKEISRLKHSLKIEIGMIDVYMSGCVACGVPASPYTDFEEPMKLPLIAPLADGKEYFILHASGDSMNKIISDGEQMIIEQTQIIEDGDIAVFLINGECTLKEYEADGDSSCILKPLSTNPIHEDQYYESTVNILVQGKYVCKVKDLLKKYDEIIKSNESL